MSKNGTFQANITGEAYEEIVNTRITKEDLENSSDKVIEQANELLNPDPNSLDSRG